MAKNRSVADRKGHRLPARPAGTEVNAAADAETRRAVQEIFAEPAMEQLLQRALAAADATADAPEQTLAGDAASPDDSHIDAATERLRAEYRRSRGV